MQKAAYYMVRHVGGPGKIDDRTKNHRFYEAAIALGATGILAGDHTLVNWSKAYARIGIRMERTDGVMPEDGGHDSGYQALGMVNASRYLQLVATGTRNNVGFDWNESFDLFTTDNDHEQDTRYVPGRLLFIVPGGFYNWPRGWMDDRPEDLPALAGMGREVPVGLAVYGDTRLPELDQFPRPNLGGPTGIDHQNLARAQFADGLRQAGFIAYEWEVGRDPGTICCQDSQDRAS